METCVEYLFPNDGHILWTLMIALYPYLTGLVGGAFVVSSLYYVFDRHELRPVARLALVGALAFMIAAPLPLLFHLGHPERCFNVMVTPNFRSAMAAFGFIYSLFLMVLIFKTWLVYRRELVFRAIHNKGLSGLFYTLLSLGKGPVSEQSFKLDRQIITVLAGVGIPLACILPGYTGFLFGSLKSNPWWSTPLMPVIFLFSAITSGIAITVVIYLVVVKFKRQLIDGECTLSLARWLWMFAILTATLEVLEIAMLAYEGNEEWLVIKPLITQKIAISFIGIQMLLGSLLPIIILGGVVVHHATIKPAVRNILSFISAILLLIQVLAMRWNVVIGGQMFSKSFRGFRETYVPEWGGREGLLVALGIFILPFIILFVFNYFLPIFQDAKQLTSESPSPDSESLNTGT